MTKTRTVAVTTTDNPYNPITQWEDWYNYDMQKGYSTCSYLDRIAHVTDEMSTVEAAEEIERAIDEMIDYGFDFDSNKKVYYKKVVTFV